MTSIPGYSIPRRITMQKISISPYLYPPNSQKGEWIDIYRPNAKNIQTLVLSKRQKKFQQFKRVRYKLIRQMARHHVPVCERGLITGTVIFDLLTLDSNRTEWVTRLTPPPSSSVMSYDDFIGYHIYHWQCICYQCACSVAREYVTCE